MTYYKRVDELRDNTNLTAENYEPNYLTAEIVLVDLLGEIILGAEVISTAYGTGKVTRTYGDTLDQMFMEIDFPVGTKRFGVSQVVCGKALFTKFADISEIGDAWDHAFDLHTDLTKQCTEFKRAEKQAELEAKKKAIAEQKAEEKYQEAKAKAIRDFENQIKTVIPRNSSDEFYFALGWLAKHAGSVTAKLPDYLESAFERHFGTDAPKTLVDSKAKTSGGFAKQWSWEFICGVKNLKNSVVPAYLNTVTSDISKGIHNTSFVWDLVDNYGFQFGKTQDLDRIRSCVPSTHISFFEAGLA